MVFGATAALWLLMNGATLRSLRHVQRLPGLTPQSGSSSPSRPKVSIILAARDEEERIENTVRHLLKQSGISLELVVVDDRSTDRTSEILRRVCAEDPRVRLLRVDVLPDLWLGKCHACHLGARHATGDWLLFTDADCWLQPDVVHRALQAAQREQADHVALTPGIPPDHLSGMAWHATFPALVATRLAGVNLDRRRCHVGVGAFNLLTREAYHAIGGHEALRLTVVDDVKLGLLIRRAGLRTRVWLGGPDVECHWGYTAWGVIKLTEKNSFAMTDYRLELALLGGLLPLLIWGLAWAGPFHGGLSGWMACAGPLLLIAPAWQVARRLGWTPWVSLLAPFLVPLIPLSMLNSTFKTLWRGGVRWRETFYPLALLRAHTVKMSLFSSDTPSSKNTSHQP